MSFSTSNKTAESVDRLLPVAILNSTNNYANLRSKLIHLLDRDYYVMVLGPQLGPLATLYAMLTQEQQAQCAMHECDSRLWHSLRLAWLCIQQRFAAHQLLLLLNKAAAPVAVQRTSFEHFYKYLATI